MMRTDSELTEPRSNEKAATWRNNDAGRAHVSWLADSEVKNERNEQRGSCGSRQCGIVQRSRSVGCDSRWYRSKMADAEAKADEERANKLTQIVAKLLLERSADAGTKREFLTKEEILFLIDGVTEVLKGESTLAELEPPAVICGDTHGQFFDLLRLFDHGGWPPDSRYLFLGDYVDRGAQSIEVICLMFAFKMAHPDDFYILRGNHECININRVYGFFDECKRRYTEDLFFRFNSAFEWLPIAGLVGGRILCMHGGLSPDLHTLDQIRHTHRPIHDVDGGMVADLMWSDPAPNIRGYVPNNRGISYKFGADAVIEFCNKLNLDMIARAHQVVMDGYDFFADDRLVTLFSAPKYCDQFDNAAAMMIVDADLTCRIKQLTL